MMNGPGLPSPATSTCGRASRSNGPFHIPILIFSDGERPACAQLLTIPLTVARGARRAACQPVTLAEPFSRWPVNRCDQELSELTVTVTSYQPFDVEIGSSSCAADWPPRTRYSCA